MIKTSSLTAKHDIFNEMSGHQQTCFWQQNKDLCMKHCDISNYVSGRDQDILIEMPEHLQVLLVTIQDILEKLGRFQTCSWHQSWDILSKVLGYLYN